MESKINDSYLTGRPFGGTAVMYNKHLSYKVSKIDTDSPRCTGIKLMLDNHCEGNTTEALIISGLLLDVK